MNMPVEVYRAQIIRAVTGNQPAMVFHVVDETALLRVCERLAESERAAAILQAKGYGASGLLLDEVAARVPASHTHDTR
ncbi:hypothetical protein IFT64_12065 [Oxalobacteraceae sp. CFBP 8753]|nr:hypothetical protein [Oxalobacteraceae sp. CFBP 8753]